MNKKNLILIIVLLIIFAVTISVGWFYWNKTQPLSKKCGDGICDDAEKHNSNLCPQDCGKKTIQSNNVKPSTNSISASSEDLPFGITSGFPIVDVPALGAKWAREGGDPFSWGAIETAKGTFNWKEIDKRILENYQNNLKMVISIGAANKWDQNTTEQAQPKLPVDIAEYKNFLVKLVERYDGDGKDDASGSPVVDIWQIENEVDIGGFGWNGSEADYVKLLKEAYKTIKQTNPNVKVAMAAIGAPPTGLNDFFVPLFGELDKIKDSANSKYFDIFDFHWYPFESQYNSFQMDQNSISLSDCISQINQLLTKYGYQNTPIYMTEVGQYSDRPAAGFGGQKKDTEFHSEKKQASDLLKIYIYPLAKGVDKIFWATMTEFPFGGNDYFANMGLINNPQNDGQSSKKLAYYTYKLMAEKLEGSDWNNIQTIQDSDGVNVYKFTKNSKSIWVAWNENTGNKTISLAVGNINSVKITEAVPKYESGKDVTDYTSAFKTETKTVSGSQISLTLGDKPAFIEE